MPGPATDLTAPLTVPGFWAGGVDRHLSRLRAEAPLAWEPDPGVWMVSRHADVLRISRDPATFCSSRGVLLMDLGRELPELPGALLYVDPPEHQRYRRILNPAFSGRRIRALEPHVRSVVTEVLDASPVGSSDPFDVVEHVAVPIPLLVICDLLGLPRDDWRKLYAWSDATIAAGTEMTDELLEELAAMTAYLMEHIARRRDDPRDDLTSDLVHHDGERLTPDELHMFLVQLLVAGNETTRNLISGSLVACAQHPEQWDAVRADPATIPTAVEEMLRWTTPVTSFLRTATRPVEVSGTAIGAGEPLLLLYASANRDESVFGPTADRFDVRRDPNPHVAFGFGEHFCLGAALARLEARVFFEELGARARRIESAGEVERLASTVIRGIVKAPLVIR